MLVELHTKAVDADREEWKDHSDANHQSVITQDKDLSDKMSQEILTAIQ